jgi:YegS/Rv2252/BmrU family lipid kinase
LTERKIAFVVNPNSSNGATGREWPAIRSEAEARLGHFHSHMTESRGHATRLTREALEGGAEIVVCVGGDGTLNETINGFMGEGGPAVPEAVLGFLPRGTGCDFVRSISIPREPDRALDNIVACRCRPIDLGRFTYKDHEGHTAHKYFHNVLSFGLGGEVDDRVNRTTKMFGGFVSFIWATLISVLAYDKKQILLSVDDHFQEEVTVWNVAVANGQYHGGGMRVAPDAALDDGLFHVTVVGDLTKAEVFWYLPRLYDGTIYDVGKVTKLTGKRIEARSRQEVLIDMDGEQPGRLPVVIEMVPAALRIVCDPG